MLGIFKRGEIYLMSENAKTKSKVIYSSRDSKYEVPVPWCFMNYVVDATVNEKCCYGLIGKV
jgi:hypothetical protein